MRRGCGMSRIFPTSIFIHEANNIKLAYSLAYPLSSYCDFLVIFIQYSRPSLTLYKRFKSFNEVETLLLHQWDKINHILTSNCLIIKILNCHGKSGWDAYPLWWGQFWSGFRSCWISCSCIFQTVTPGSVNRILSYSRRHCLGIYDFFSLFYQSMQEVIEWLSRHKGHFHALLNMLCCLYYKSVVFRLYDGPSVYWYWSQFF